MTKMRHEMPSVALLTLVLVATCVTSLADAGGASAEPSRRASRHAAPASPAHSAPDVTGSLKNPKAAPAPPPAMPVVKNDDDAPLKPFDLPAAPRGRMRQCGEIWQKIKLSGEAGDRTWREFATVCLTERTGASPSASAQNVSDAASR